MISLNANENAVESSVFVSVIVLAKPNSAGTGFDLQGNAKHTYFGLGIVTAIPSFEAADAPSQSNYSAASCSVNFLGTFDLLDCLGYMIVPGESLYATYGSLKDSLLSRFP